MCKRLHSIFIAVMMLFKCVASAETDSIAENVISLDNVDLPEIFSNIKIMAWTSL